MGSKGFVFGNFNVFFKKGEKEIKDYVILWDDIQFTDKTLFENLVKILPTWDVAKNFLKQLLNFEGIMIKDDRFLINNEDRIYNYVSKLSINHEQKRAIFSILHRCNIDNINYPPSRFNGAIRHIVQIIILFGFVFNKEDIIPKKLKRINGNPIEIVYNIGHPNNPHSLDKEEFNQIYQELVKNDFLKEVH